MARKKSAGADPGEQARAAIDTVRLVKRLQLYVLGENDEAGNPVELDAAKLKVIEMLLKKTLPDLASVSLGGGPDKSFSHALEKIVREIVDPRDAGA